MADCSPWQWSGWRGVQLAARHRMADALMALATWLIP